MATTLDDLIKQAQVVGGSDVIEPAAKSDTNSNKLDQVVSVLKDIFGAVTRLNTNIVKITPKVEADKSKGTTLEELSSDAAALESGKIGSFKTFWDSFLKADKETGKSTLDKLTAIADTLKEIKDMGGEGGGGGGGLLGEGLGGVARGAARAAGGFVVKRALPVAAAGAAGLAVGGAVVKPFLDNEAKRITGDPEATLGTALYGDPSKKLAASEEADRLKLGQDKLARGEKVSPPMAEFLKSKGVEVPADKINNVKPGQVVTPPVSTPTDKINNVKPGQVVTPPPPSASQSRSTPAELGGFDPGVSNPYGTMDIPPPVPAPAPPKVYNRVDPIPTPPKVYNRVDPIPVTPGSDVDPATLPPPKVYNRVDPIPVTPGSDVDPATLPPPTVYNRVDPIPTPVTPGSDVDPATLPPPKVYNRVDPIPASPTSKPNIVANPGQELTKFHSVRNEDYSIHPNFKQAPATPVVKDVWAGRRQPGAYSSGTTEATTPEPRDYPRASPDEIEANWAKKNRMGNPDSVWAGRRQPGAYSSGTTEATTPERRDYPRASPEEIKANWEKRRMPDNSSKADELVPANTPSTAAAVEQGTIEVEQARDAATSPGNTIINAPQSTNINNSTVSSGGKPVTRNTDSTVADLNRSRYRFA